MVCGLKWEPKTLSIRLSFLSAQVGLKRIINEMHIEKDSQNMHGVPPADPEHFCGLRLLSNSSAIEGQEHRHSQRSPWRCHKLSFESINVGQLIKDCQDDLLYHKDLQTLKIRHKDTWKFTEHKFSCSYV